jgi:hypothetical protein
VVAKATGTVSQAAGWVARMADRVVRRLDELTISSTAGIVPDQLHSPVLTAAVQRTGDRLAAHTRSM